MQIKNKVMEILSPASLIGYLQGNMKFLISLIEVIPEDKRTYAEKKTINVLKETIFQSDEAWEKVKSSY